MEKYTECQNYYCTKNISKRNWLFYEKDFFEFDGFSS